MKNLEQTVELMLSEDYKKRFEAEYIQTKIRLKKLEDMLSKWDRKELDFTPTCPRSIYDKQVKFMKGYLEVLEFRAELEGI